MVAAMRGEAAPGPEMAEVRDTRVRVSGGPCRSVSSARPAPAGVIVYYHGGGWVLGGLDESDASCRRPGAASAVRVVCADYRLAPEYRFPTAVDDAWAALVWAAAHAAELAGGRAADRGRRQRRRQPRRGDDACGPGPRAARLAVQVLVYPVTDCDLERRPTPTRPTAHADPGLDDLVLGPLRARPAGPGRNPDASPLRDRGLRRAAARGASSPPSTTCCATRESSTLRSWSRPVSRCSTSGSRARCTGSSPWWTCCRGRTAMDFVVDGIEKHLAAGLVAAGGGNAGTAR